MTAQEDRLREQWELATSQNTARTVRRLVKVAGALILLVFVSYFLKFGGSVSPSKGEWGQFGDFIGGTLNPILSFLSLIALVSTVILQVRQLEHSRQSLKNSEVSLQNSKDELQNSREELKLTRDEMARATAAQSEVAKAAQEQARYANISIRLSALQAALSIAQESLKEIQEVKVNRDTTEMQKRRNLCMEISAQIINLSKDLLKSEYDREQA